MPDNSVIRGRRTGGRRTAAVGAALAAGLFVASPAAHAIASVAHPAGASARAGAEAQRLTPEVRARLDRAVTAVMKQTGVPGAVVSLSIPGKGDYTRSFGVADRATGTPLAGNIAMRVGSLTKTFTATAVLQLVDRHRVHLDDPVARYAPGVPQGDRITLRHLLEMRSGLFDYMLDDDLGRAWAADPHRQWTAEQVLPYAFRHPAAAPGTEYHYSNTNYALLGLVVEKASGRPLGSYLQQHVIAPAGLRHTFYPEGAEFPAPHAHGYTDQTADGSVGDATDWNPSIGGAAGAMVSNVSDLRQWARVVAEGTLLSPAAQAQRTAFLPTGVEGAGYGLGVFDNHGWIGHNGSLPGYQTVAVYLPQAGATLVLHTTTDIRYQGISPSTLLAKAVTEVVTPQHVYDLKPPKPAPAPSPSQVPARVPNQAPAPAATPTGH
ncbi:serine hydrolase domain-containing protein [Kitasatospora sp. NPDC059571]|uniref:serine hydrolase domain-containing protein n=1 Tax=Kitasatospora sp. NPDC059571 TaxID=3346871 RepID=UPI0036939A81